MPDRDVSPPATSRSQIVKAYALADLLDPDFRKRMRLIESVSSSLQMIPVVTFQALGTSVIYSQHRVARHSWPTAEIRRILAVMASGLEDMAGFGLVHGDVNFKNVVFDGTCARLVDLEPSLRQLRQGRPVLLFTPPYISLDDYRSGTLTTTSDKVGFFFLCLRLLGPWPRFSPREAMRKIAHGQASIDYLCGIDEGEVTARGFPAILSLAEVTAQ